MPRHRILPALTLSLAAWLPLASHAGESRIELTDGSVITGELVGIDAGYYRIRSRTLGDLSIPESSIAALRPQDERDADTGDRSMTPSPAEDYSGEIAALQRRFATDQGLMAQIMALQQDPDIQQALSDPELSRMILSGDLDRLQSDPRFQQLISNPSIQALIRQVIGQ